MYALGIDRTERASSKPRFFSLAIDRSSHLCAITRNSPRQSTNTMYRQGAARPAAVSRRRQVPASTAVLLHTVYIRIEPRSNRNATAAPPVCKPVPAPLCWAISIPTNVPRQKATSTSGEIRSTDQHEQVLLPFFFFAELGLLLLEDAERLSLFWWYSGMSALGAMAFCKTLDLIKELGQRRHRSECMLKNWVYPAWGRRAVGCEEEIWNTRSSTEGGKRERNLRQRSAETRQRPWRCLSPPG